MTGFPTKTPQRKPSRFFHTKEIYSPSISLERPKTISQSEETPLPAKICGNCQIFNLTRSRSIATLISLGFEYVCTHENIMLFRKRK